MIINPQLFKFRLIIGSLAIAIVILSSFGYMSYNNLKENQEFIVQEKGLVENELSEMISSYEAVDVKKDSIAKQLEETKSKIVTILDSVKQLKPNASIISNYEAQIKVLKEENVQLIALTNSLKPKKIDLKPKVIEDTSVDTKPDNTSPIAPVFK